MNQQNDPIGKAILDYQKDKKGHDIIVHSNLCEDDIIPVEVLFRSYKEMPEIEKKALELCRGKILDIGAGAGVHTLHLLNNNKEVACIDSSLGACEYLKSKKLKVYYGNFENFKFTNKFDTLLLLMNGIGIAKKKDNLNSFFIKAKEILNPNGQIIFDSSDVLFLYENEDGSYDLDLNSGYYGDFKFQLEYKKEKSNWFDWLYIDYENMHKIAVKNGFECKRVLEFENHYLAQLILK